MDLKVRKKDGRIEDYDRNKIIRGAVGAGASFEEAGKIADQVMTWGHSAAQEGVVDSSAIRTKVLELLQGANPVLASSFESYKK